MAHYLTFVAFALLIVIAPGPDTVLTLRTTMVRGRAAGLWCTLGITVAGTVQGVLAATGLGAVIVHAEPVFQAIRWAGVVYLTYLGVMALRAALRRGDDPAEQPVDGRPATRPWRAVRSGFLCNITNPKVLAFNLAVLPQFATPGTGTAGLLAYALTLSVLGGLYLVVVVLVAGRASAALRRRRVRRSVDATMGVAMVGFATALAVES